MPSSKKSHHEEKRTGGELKDYQNSLRQAIKAQTRLERELSKSKSDTQKFRKLHYSSLKKNNDQKSSLDKIKISLQTAKGQNKILQHKLTSSEDKMHIALTEIGALEKEIQKLKEQLKKTKDTTKVNQSSELEVTPEASPAEKTANEDQSSEYSILHPFSWIGYGGTKAEKDPGPSRIDLLDEIIQSNTKNAIEAKNTPDTFKLK